MLDRLVEFVPASGRDVSFYVCGPTVYDSSHLGHARNYVTFDVIRRILTDHFGYNVRCVMNITDVDDKIIIKARKEFLLNRYLEQNPSLTDEVLAFVRSAMEQDVASSDATKTATLADLTKSEAERLGVARLLEARIATAQELLKAETWAQFKVGAASSELVGRARDALMSALDAKFKDSISDLDVRPVAARFEKEFLEDMDRLGVIQPDALTRVSEYIPQIVDYVKKIIDNGYGYESNGSVYFDTKKYMEDGHHDYGKLAPSKVGNVREQEDADGALTAVTVKDDKKTPSDFVLWKKSRPGEPVWDSPWGKGRPGWHIECSAMASDLLGMTLDVHAGGQDLYFPHHENEIAQCEAFFHDQGCKQWVNYFLHSGHLHIDGLKMAKSLKNFISIRQAFEPPYSYTARQLRLFFVTRSWNKEVNFDKKTMEEVFATERTLDTFFATIASVMRAQKTESCSQSWGAQEKILNDAVVKAENDVHASFCNNFDTKAAITALVTLAKALNEYISHPEVKVKQGMLLAKAGRAATKTLRVLGLAPGGDAIGWSAGDGGAVGSDDALVDAFYNFRQKVRQAAKDKDTAQLMAASDDLRDNVLPVLGLKFDDSELGWKRVDSQKAMQEIAERRRLEVQKLEKKLVSAQNDLATLEKQSKPASSVLEEGEYGAFDDKGFPTKMADGSDIEKNRLKKLQKLWSTQEKAYAKFCEKQKKAGEKDVIEEARMRVKELEDQIAAARK